MLRNHDLKNRTLHQQTGHHEGLHSNLHLRCRLSKRVPYHLKATEGRKGGAVMAKKHHEQVLP
jgi:hypothetical protein